MKKISVSRAFYSALQLMYHRFAASMFLALCGFMLSENLIIILAYLMGLIDENAKFLHNPKIMIPLGIGFTIMYLIIRTFIAWSLYQFSLTLIDDPWAPVHLKFPRKVQFNQALHATILYIIYTVGGLMLCIIPGLLATVRLMFFNLLIIERGLNVRESIKESWHITRGNALRLTAFLMIFNLLDLGAKASFKPVLLLIIPLEFYVMAHIYRQLVDHPNSNMVV